MSALVTTGLLHWRLRMVYPFFYPSVGVSALLDKFLDFGKNVDLFKLRASYSIVGNDVPIYASNKRYTIGDQGSIDPPEEAAFRTFEAREDELFRGWF